MFLRDCVAKRQNQNYAKNPDDTASSTHCDFADSYIVFLFMGSGGLVFDNSYYEEQRDGYVNYIPDFTT